jgi:myo-inositol-1(or 4)-monophosphatase
MAKTTADPLHFPNDEVTLRLDHIKNNYQKIVQSCRDLQGKLSFSESISDEREKEILDEVDSEFEKILVDHIGQMFSKDSFRCESAGTIEGKGDFTWTLDAIDGSINFLRKLPLYAISLGIAFRKKPVAAIILLPDLGDIYTAIHGEGAYKNNHPIHVSSVGTIDRALLISSFPSYRNTNVHSTLSEIAAFVSKGRSIRRTGSIVVDICWLAEGRLDGLWEKDVSEFDLAASTLLLLEAGGALSDMKGGEIESYPSDLVISNGIIQSQIIDILRKARIEHTLN